MAFEKRPMTGMLFREEDATEENKRPVMKGWLKLEHRGETIDIKLSGWKKISTKTNKAYLMLAAEFEKAEENPSRPPPQRHEPVPDDDIPF